MKKPGTFLSTLALALTLRPDALAQQQQVTVPKSSQSDSGKTEEQLVNENLHKAIMAEDEAAIKEIVSKNQSIIKRPIVAGGDSPLHVAVSEGKEKAARTLIELGSDVNTPVYVQESNTAPGARPLVRAFTPLYRAVIGKHISTATLLLEKGADTQRAVTIQEPRPADLIYAAMDGFTALHAAVEVKSPEMVELLLGQRGANPEIQDARGQTALHLAVSNNSESIVQALIKNGANVNARMGEQRPELGENASLASPVQVALDNNNILLAETLIKDHAANPQIPDRYGQTALMNAAARNDFAAVRMLLNQPATQINAANEKTGDTALHYAYRNGHMRIVELLEEKGASKDIKNKEGKTPAELKERASVWQNRSQQASIKPHSGFERG